MFKVLNSFFLTVSFQVLLSPDIYAQNNTAYQADSQRVRMLLSAADNCVLLAKEDCRKNLDNALKKSLALNSPFLISLCYRSFANAERRNRTPRLFKYDSLSVIYARSSANDSLIISAILNQSHDFCLINKPEKAKRLIEEALVLVEKNESNYLKLLLQYEYGLYFLKSRKFTEAGNRYRQALAYAEKLKDPYWTAILHRSVYYTNVLGYKKTDTSVAVFDALEYLRKNDKFEAANCLYIIGFGYKAKGNLEKANAYFTEAAALYKAKKYYLHEADMYNAMAEHSIITKEFSKGLSLTAQSEKIFTSIGYTDGIITTYFNYARLYGASGDIVRSDMYFEKVNAILKASPDAYTSRLLISYKALRDFNNGTTSVKSKLIDSAAAGITKLLSKEVVDSMISRSESTGLLSKSEAQDLKRYSRTGKLDTSLWKKKNDLENINPYTGDLLKFNSSYNELYNRQLTEMETKYKTQIKDDSLNNVINENKISQLKISNRNRLIFLIFVIAIAAAIIFYQVNRHLSNKAKRALHEKKTIEVFKEEADHRVQNTLSNINSIISIVKSKAADKLLFNLLEERINPLMLLYQKLTVNKDESIRLQDYFEDICSRLKRAYGSSCVEVNVSAPVIMEGKTAGLAGLIVNELVTNSFKYAFEENKPGIINIVCDKDEQKEYKLQVSDSGKGFENAEGNAGTRGLLLVKALAAQMRARVIQKTGGGVCFEFYFKEKPVI
ncbi:MAG: sensor histidine kinase [Ferruginibacter sp.]|nr:sensor histidine kinase [Ferruginibacter sp.]